MMNLSLTLGINQAGSQPQICEICGGQAPEHNFCSMCAAWVDDYSAALSAAEKMGS